MPDYLVECGILNLWFAGLNIAGGGPDPQVAQIAESRKKTSLLLMSAISRGELEYGHALAAGPAGTRQALVKFLDALPAPIAVTHHTAAIYGVLRARLADQFPPVNGWKTNKKRRSEQLYDPLAGRELGIDENDLWIASQAIELGLILVTNDKMTRIKAVAAKCAKNEFGLDFLHENWKTAQGALPPGAGATPPTASPPPSGQSPPSSSGTASPP